MYFDSNYYTKSQDVWDEWIDSLIVHNTTKIDDTTSIVPISFKLSETTYHHLIIFVQREKGALKITKVVDTEGGGAR
jgi:hypothetical protein